MQACEETRAHALKCGNALRQSKIIMRLLMYQQGWKGPHPFKSKLKSPMPATTHPATNRQTDAIMSRGGALLVCTACNE